MMLVDANLLVYARVRDFAQHEAARAWLQRQLNEAPRVGLPWPSLLAFVRLTTNPRIFRESLSTAVAWSQVKDWLNQPAVWIPRPGENHALVLDRLMQQVDRPTLVPDAHLAALAIERGLTLCSTDGDFARFTELRWQNPLRA